MAPTTGIAMCQNRVAVEERFESGVGYDRPICALAGCDSYALDCGSWGTERPLSPVICDTKPDTNPIVATSRVAASNPVPSG
jgi:hypothetical protein